MEVGRGSSVVTPPYLLIGAANSIAGLVERRASLPQAFRLARRARSVRFVVCSEGLRRSAAPH